MVRAHRIPENLLGGVSVLLLALEHENRHTPKHCLREPHRPRLPPIVYQRCTCDPSEEHGACDAYF
jgi:hypothetical protein